MRFSDKISNLKFHRNFTILGSKLIVLSTGTSNHPRRALSLSLAPLFSIAAFPSPRFPPNASTVFTAFARLALPRLPFAKGTLKISSLLLITRHAYRRGLRGVPKGLTGRRITTLIYKVSEIQPVRGYATSGVRYIDLKSH